LWVDSQPGQGSIFSVLFPLGYHTQYQSDLENDSETSLLSDNGREDA
jgi:hypothetical protein